MTLDQFNEFSDNMKWSNWKLLKNVSWACAECGEINGEEPKSMYMGSLHCGECVEQLTCRTNGGQNNPFGWKAVNK